MRLPLLFLLLTGLFATPACTSRGGLSADPSLSVGNGPMIVRIQPGYRTTESFQRLSEFLTGKENTGKETVLRSQPASRDGYYWFLRLKNTGAAESEATFELQTITPANPEAKKFTFRAPLPKGNQIVEIGLTGTDWPDPAALPVAWQLQIRTGTGAVSAQSFLWSKPAAPTATPGAK